MGKKQEVLDIDKGQRTKDFWRRNRYEIDDRFVIKDGKKHKCAIICPGGGYTVVCSFVEGVPFAKRLNELGISAFIVYYRVRRKAKFPNPQDDLARAVEEIHSKADEYHLDMDGYSVWGSSAGGHLAASFGTTKMGYLKYGLPKPGAMVLIYPVISLESTKTHMGTRNNLIGKDAGREKELEYSIHTNVDSNYPPTFIWNGLADKTVPPENTTLMEEALQKNEIPHVCKQYDGVDHGVGLATKTAAEEWFMLAVNFWMKQGEYRDGTSSV